MADSKSAGEILEAVVKDGREELDRASLGLTFSGVAAGFNISFSAVALGIVGALTGGVGLAAYLVYPLGFLIVILGRAQVFTENTVTPGTVALTDPRAVPNMLRLWVVVFVTNILGATLFSAVTSTGTSSSSALRGSCSRRPPTRRSTASGPYSLRPSSAAGSSRLSPCSWRPPRTPSPRSSSFSP